MPIPELRERTLLVSLPGHEALGVALAADLGVAEGAVTMREFPDGETYVRADTRCDGRDVILVADLSRPDPRFLPLVYSVQALRDVGARRVVLVAPYLPYMRQDARFQPGELVTSRVFARLLSATVDGLVTIDPHLHRYATLGEIYRIPTGVEHATRAIADWISTHVEQPVIVGPDIESEQWVGDVARRAGAPYLVLAKQRHGDHDVQIEAPALDKWRAHTPVLVDDIISTAHTMIETLGHFARAGLAPAICIGVHAIFARDAYEALQKAGSAAIVTCNTVPHPSNAIDLSDTLAAGIRSLLEVNRPTSSAPEPTP